MLSRDLGLKLASLVVALILWGYVMSQAIQNQTDSVQFQVVPLSVPAGLEVANKIDPVTIVADGPPDAISELKHSGADKDPRLVAYVDLRDATEGKAQYRPYLTSFPRPDLRLNWPRPDKVTIELQSVVSLPKPVALQPVNAPEGYDVTLGDPSPESVTVTGRKSNVDKVAQVRALVDLSDFKPGKKEKDMVIVDLLDSKGKPVDEKLVQVSPRTVSVHPVVSESQPRRHSFVTPIVTGQPAFGYRVAKITATPSQIWVTGDPKILKSLDVLETEPLDISSARFDVTRRLRVNLPTGVSGKTTAVRVLVHIRQLPQSKASIGESRSQESPRSTFGP